MCCATNVSNWLRTNMKIYFRISKSMNNKKTYYRINFDMYLETIDVTKIDYDEKERHFERVRFDKIDLADAFHEY